MYRKVKITHKGKKVRSREFRNLFPLRYSAKIFAECTRLCCTRWRSKNSKIAPSIGTTGNGARLGSMAPVITFVSALTSPNIMETKNFQSMSIERFYTRSQPCKFIGTKDGIGLGKQHGRHVM